MKRVTYKNLTEEQKASLKEIYYPIFDRISDMKFSDAYILAQDICDLSESGVRCALKNEYEKRELSINEESIAKKQHSLQYDIHKHRREKLTFNATVRDKYDSLMLMETLRDRLYELEIFSYKSPSKQFVISNHSQHVFLSDLHIGKYTKEEHREMLEDVANKIYDNSNGDYGLNLVFAGDIVDGLLRMSQIQKVKANMVEQVFWANELLIEFIENLSQRVKIDSIFFVDDDNHGEIRPLGSGRGDFPELNLGKFVSDSLRQYCKMKDVNYYSGEIVTIQVDGEFVPVFHGHQFKGKGAIKKYYENTKCIHGHFHEYSNDGSHICLPALCLGDEYTKSLGIRTGKAGFLMEQFGFYKKINI